MLDLARTEKKGSCESVSLSLVGKLNPGWPQFFNLFLTPSRLRSHTIQIDNFLNMILGKHDFRETIFFSTGYKRGRPEEQTKKEPFFI